MGKNNFRDKPEVTTQTPMINGLDQTAIKTREIIAIKHSEQNSITAKQAEMKFNHSRINPVSSKKV